LSVSFIFNLASHRAGSAEAAGRERQIGKAAADMGHQRMRNDRRHARRVQKVAAQSVRRVMTQGVDDFLIVGMDIRSCRRGR
jgi:hypothetical protein